MEELEMSEGLNKLLSLSKEELNSIFSKLSVKEIENLLNKLNEVDINE